MNFFWPQPIINSQKTRHHINIANNKNNNDDKYNKNNNKIKSKLLGYDPIIISSVVPIPIYLLITEQVLMYLY